MVDRVPGALQPAARTINVRNLAGAARAAIGAQAPIFEARDLGGVDPLHAAALRDQAEQAELVVEPVIGRLGARRPARFIIDDREPSLDVAVDAGGRSEGGRVGKECVRTCRSRWWPYHSKKTT